MKIRCKACGSESLVSKLEAAIFVLSARKKKSAGLPFPCASCGEDLHSVGQLVRQRTLDNQHRSKKQEKRVAVRECARRQPGSGARDGWEGDVRSPGRYRGECKFTRASSYNLKLTDLKKLEAQAASNELPAFDVEFQSESPAKRYVILPEWAYETLMTESGRRSNAEHDQNDQ